MQSMRKYKISILVLLFIAAVVLFAIPEKKAEAAEKSLASINAVYTGDTVMVGDSIDLKKLTVMGLYTDGSYVKIKDYSLSTYGVAKAGDNVITVYSGGVRTTFIVKGRSVLRISAYYSQSSVTVGERLDPDKVMVYVTYSDGQNKKVTDFTLSSTLVNEIGKNEFTVTYEDKSAKFSVTGKEERKPRSMYARYNGPAIIVGNAPKREDFYVTVFFNDNTSERITEFELTPSIVQDEGSNVVIVSYGELSYEVKVQGLAKKVLSITAEYTGFPVIIGKTVASEDIKVTATFNDGTKDTVTNFTLSSSVIYKIGDNLITVFCDGKTARIKVRGVEAEIIDYRNGAEALIRDEGIYTRVKLAVGGKADSEQVRMDKVSKSLVEKAMRRLVQTDEYIAFEVSFDDPEMDRFLPMTMKVSVPAGYDLLNFGVFYTPNRKTIMAKMNGEFLNDGYYEFKMFQPGTYIIADCTPLIYVETLEFEEENLSLRVGRSYTLDPVILPHTATNKEVTYTSSRPQIVSVSEYGTLKALKTGTALITVEATDDSGKTATLRVNVVEKKGKFDADIAYLSDALNKVRDAEDFMDFLEIVEEDIADKYHELSEREYKEYVKEVENWSDSWDENSIEMDDDEWIYLLELLYEAGLYSYGEVLFGENATIKKEIANLEKQMEAIETMDDFMGFYESFFYELEKKCEEWEEEEVLLYLMALSEWGQEVQEESVFYDWDEEMWEQHQDWLYELGSYGW